MWFFAVLLTFLVNTQRLEVVADPAATGNVPLNSCGRGPSSSSGVTTIRKGTNIADITRVSISVCLISTQCGENGELMTKSCLWLFIALRTFLSDFLILRACCGTWGHEAGIIPSQGSGKICSREHSSSASAAWSPSPNQLTGSKCWLAGVCAQSQRELLQCSEDLYLGSSSQWNPKSKIHLCFGLVFLIHKAFSKAKTYIYFCPSSDAVTLGFVFFFRFYCFLFCFLIFTLHLISINIFQILLFFNYAYTSSR